MSAPINTFKQALSRGERQTGCWLSSGEAMMAEVMGSAGFDWLVIDGEHGPNDIRSIRDQLMALANSPSHPVVRVPIGETWMIKQVLDAGAQTVMVPMVDSAAQASDLVRAMKYPPFGTRGVGAAAARATGFGGIPNYVTTADDQTCLLVQVESRAGIAALDEISAVEGVDGVFIGPADLSTDMGFQGDSAAPEVQKVIAQAVTRIHAAGKASGLLGITDESVQGYHDMGTTFLAVGIDVVLLARSARALAKRWQDV